MVTPTSTGWPNATTYLAGACWVISICAPSGSNTMASDVRGDWTTKVARISTSPRFPSIRALPGIGLLHAHPADIVLFGKLTEGRAIDDGDVDRYVSVAIGT